MRMTRQRGPASFNYPGYPVAMGTAASSILCPFHKVTITHSKRSCQRSEMPPSIPCTKSLIAILESLEIPDRSLNCPTWNSCQV
ncbi:hypothetical protein I305_03410, partial [Cryptococcus gattii E566]